MIDIKKIESSKMRNLYNNLTEGNYKALDVFWSELEQSGSPLIEEIEGDNKNVMVTFIYKAKEKIKNVVVYGAFPSYRYNENIMEQLLDSNLWYKTYKVRNDIKFAYNYSVNDALDDDYKKRFRNFILDEFNLNTIVFPKDEEDEEDREEKRSLVELCNVKPDIWTKTMKHSNNGTLDLHRFKSNILNNSRRVWVYKPYKYEENNEKNNLIILTDGFMHINILNAINVLDNLMYKELIPKSVCVFIDSNNNRVGELAFNKNYGEFITHEILSWVHNNYNVTTESEKTIIGGVSLGALAASYIALTFPNVFGNVLAQSGSFFWDEEWLIDKYKNSDKMETRFYLNVGFLEDRPYDDEPIMKDSIDRMRDVLITKGYDVFYEHSPSGHDFLSWGEKLATGLIALIGKK
ncbi:alpha/beta hydrolase [Clostridium ihumii]|uniref:alpha/beta hydrolase n=1 Tax=Clostridium ihumii TaxID=1470356 RepID=UPI000555FB11|nr:alpha/beta hydrolase-fold protein [Clostridium ihumii]